MKEDLYEKEQRFLKQCRELNNILPVRKYNDLNHISFIVDGRTPSINHLYGQKGHIKFLTKEARIIRNNIRASIISKINPKIRISDFEYKKLKLLVEVNEDWHNKNKSVKRSDIANREKFLIDSVFSALGLDDKYIFDHRMIKVQNEKEFTKVNIYIL